MKWYNWILLVLAVALSAMAYGEGVLTTKISMAINEGSSTNWDDTVTIHRDSEGGHLEGPWHADSFVFDDAGIFPGVTITPGSLNVYGLSAFRGGVGSDIHLTTGSILLDAGDITATLGTVYAADITALDGGTISTTGTVSGDDATFSGDLTADTIALTLGSTIDEFSTDVTLSGDDSEVPTELAVRTAIDNDVEAIDLDFSADLGSGNVVLFDGDFKVSGVPTQIATSAALEEVTISLTDTVEIVDDLGIGISPTQRLHVSEDVNGFTLVRVDNPSTNTASASGYQIAQGSGLEQNTVNLIVYDPGFTGVTGYADRGVLYSDPTMDGLAFAARDANGDIRFFAGDSAPVLNTDEKMVIGPSGVTLENGTTINEFSTDDTLAGDSDSAVPTEQAVKAYVDNSVSAAALDISADSGSSSVALDSEELKISGTSNQIVTSTSPQEIVVALTSSVTIPGTMTAEQLTSTDDGSIADNLYVGGAIGVQKVTPDSPLHTFEDNALTGINNGVTIEQDGDGDSTLKYRLTGVRTWMAGVDNSDGDAYKVSYTNDFDTGEALVISSTGNMTNEGNFDATGTVTALGLMYNGGMSSVSGDWTTGGDVDCTNLTADRWNTDAVDDTWIDLDTSDYMLRINDYPIIQYQDTTQNILELGDEALDIDIKMNNNSIFVQGSDGYVGILDATPSVPLSVTGAISATGAITGEHLRSTDDAAIDDDLNVLGNTCLNDIDSTANERLVVGRDLGVIALGGETLVIGDNSADANFLVGQSTGALAGVAFSWDYNATPASSDGGAINTFGYNNDLRIDCDDLILQDVSNGFVGVNTPPSYQLDVLDDISGFTMSITNDGNNTNRAGLRIQGGTDAPTVGDNYIQFFDGDGDTVGGIRYKTTGAAGPEFYLASDRKLKEDIIDTEKDGLALVEALRVRDYTLKKTGARHTGYVAQEFETVFPGAVTTKTQVFSATITDYDDPDYTTRSEVVRVSNVTTRTIAGTEQWEWVNEFTTKTVVVHEIHRKTMMMAPNVVVPFLVKAIKQQQVQIRNLRQDVRSNRIALGALFAMVAAIIVWIRTGTPPSQATEDDFNEKKTEIDERNAQ